MNTQTQRSLWPAELSIGQLVMVIVIEADGIAEAVGMR